MYFVSTLEKVGNKYSIGFIILCAFQEDGNTADFHTAFPPSLCVFLTKPKRPWPFLKKAPCASPAHIWVDFTANKKIGTTYTIIVPSWMLLPKAVLFSCFIYGRAYGGTIIGDNATFLSLLSVNIYTEDITRDVGDFNELNVHGRKIMRTILSCYPMVQWDYLILLRQ